MRAAVLLVLGGLVLALGGAAWWTGQELAGARSAEEDRRAVMRVARAHALNLVSINHQTVDQDIGRLLATSTGAAREIYSRTAGRLRATTVDDKVVQTGVLRSAGLVSMRGGSARVLVVADALIRWEAAESREQERFYRWEMVVTRVGRSWLVSEAEQVS